jgi:hypothetical protein
MCPRRRIGFVPELRLPRYRATRAANGGKFIGEVLRDFGRIAGVLRRVDLDDRSIDLKSLARVFRRAVLRNGGGKQECCNKAYEKVSHRVLTRSIRTSRFGRKLTYNASLVEHPLARLTKALGNF